MQNRDELSHAWPFEPLRVNVINVHGYNAEVQQRLLYALRGNTEPGHFKTCTDLFQEHARHTHTAQEYYGAYFPPFVAKLLKLLVDYHKLLCKPGGKSCWIVGSYATKPHDHETGFVNTHILNRRLTPSPHPERFAVSSLSCDVT